MLRFFAGHPTAATLLMLALCFLGLKSISQLQRDTFPEVEIFKVNIRLPYPGGSAQDVLDGICRPLENALDGISYLQEKRCDARDNLGTMTVEMAEEGSFDEFYDDVQNAVDAIDSFPEGSEAATLAQPGRTNPVVTIAMTADLPAQELKNLAELVLAKLKQQAGIPLVELTGFSQRQLIIALKPNKLRQYNISVEQIVTIIRQQNVNMPLGDLNTASKEYKIRLDQQKLTSQQLQNLVILSAGNGSQVRLAELATISDDFENHENQILFDGKRAALFNISKNKQDDSLNVLAATQTFFDQLQQELPEGIEFHITRNVTSIVKDRLSMLINNAWQGLVLVFISLSLFFGLRYSFWVIMGLPVSFLASMYLMVQFGITLNMMSMVALLLALGILMDDAIVIAESIATQFKQGKKPLDAVVEGIQRVAQGVISSFLTTVLMFGALLGLQGDLGQVLKVVPMVLLVVIAISLVEAFFILPNHLFHSLANSEEKPGKLQSKINQWLEELRESLGQLVEKLIAHRYVVVGCTVLLFFSGIAAMQSGILKFSALPAMDGDVLEARLIMPAGSPLSLTEQRVEDLMQAMHQTEQQLASREKNNQLVMHHTVTFNYNQDAFEQGPHLATISLDLLTAEQRHTTIDEFIEVWREHMPDMPGIVSLNFSQPQIGPAGRAIEMRLSGRSLEDLSSISKEVQHWLNRYDGTYGVFDDYRPGKTNLVLSLNSNAYSLGLNAHQVANQLQAAFNGIRISENYLQLTSSLNTTLLNNASDDFEIYVQLDQQQQSLESFLRFPVKHSQSGQLIPLQSLLDIQYIQPPSRIHRINNTEVVTVYGSVNSDKNNTQEILLDTLANKVPELRQRYPGLIITLEGEMKNANVTQKSLLAGLLAGLVGVYILLSFQFRSYSEPLLVMIAIPLSLIGVIGGHLLLGYNLTMPSMIGFVSLAGIVVNDAILLVEFVKHNHKGGLDFHHAARMASQQRLRAILLTTITTVAGMLPLLFESSLQAQILKPLVISIAFGLMMSTVLILIILPCMYTMLDDVKAWRSRLQQ